MTDVAPATDPAAAPPADAPLIGRVVATERLPSTPHAFHFWTRLDAPIGIGTIVRVASPIPVAGVRAQVYGVVTEGQGYSDLQSPLHDVLAQDGAPDGARAATDRTEIRLYTAQVLRQLPEEPLQPVPLGAVYLATEQDVAVALRMDGYLAPERRTAIPVGVYRAGGLEVPVHLDADFLVGPEAAHLAISGVSGLATKTSAILFLLQSLFAHFPPRRGRVAAVCFNVKGPDLCFLDQPGAVAEADQALYDRLGVPAAPFPAVHYYAPYTARGTTLNTLRAHPDLAHNVTPLTWGLPEVLQYAEVLLSKEDLDAKADALIDFIRERVVGRRFTDPALAQAHEVHSFADLEAWFRDVLRALEEGGREQWRTHHAATLRKVRNRLGNLSTRCAGLVTDDGALSDLPFGAFEDRAVYVVDVARVEEDAQDLVFARVVSRLREHLERRDLGVEHVVVFVDELNKYAPADGPDTYVRKMLLDIAERGRYLGLVLFGAQQFRSQVHRRVVGNAGTSVFGRMDGEELATPGYQGLSPAVKARLATLDKGQLLVRHPHFAQPVFVRFPRPAVMAGREGVERFPPPPEPTWQQAVARDLRRLDPGIELGWVTEVTALLDEGEALAARNTVLRQRPDDVRAAFLRALARRARPASVDAETVAPRPRALRPFAPGEYGG